MPDKNFLDDNAHLDIFKDLIDQSSDAIFIVHPESGRVLYANQQACTLLEYDYAQLTSLHLWDYAENATTQDEFQSFRQEMALAKNRRFETYQRTRSRQRVPVEVSVRMVRCQNKDYLVSSVRDIRSRKAYEASLIHERNKLEAVIAAIEDGMTVISPDYRVLYQNPSHLRKQGDQLGRPCYLAYHGLETVCEGCLVAQTLQDGKIHKRQVEALNTDGRLHFEVTSCPIRDADGKISSVVESVRDITRQKLAEEALQESMRLRTEFISIAAHELRTPLAVVIGYAELLATAEESEEFSQEEKKGFIEEILAKAGALNKIIDKLLDLSRIERGQNLSIEVKSVNLMEMLHNIFRSYVNLFPRYRFNITMAEDIAEVFEVDRKRITQALENILGNAIRYSKPGSFIHLNVEETQDGLKLSVRDEGIGMTEDEVKRIFEPFYRARPDDPTVRGLGLGMSLVKHIIEAHRGQIKVESIPLEGTTVTLVLPRSPLTSST
ncbi:PAS domain-containing sensor histidine kinase [Desulfuromonas sp. AOP6]|uniref:sensor histidine kinase n=1 Tax=Desulfuromonas sp. AOP6 TaxID=1566351 RepID=UPI00126E4751|nr:PAS domain-containing sensor histidine kinase [Desulfuromonas sp. AOP6]BCA80180.1 hypothetical protein AOP6_1967 [Desulfuromonas sp. AOP6]